jgi:hypothetical protein
MSYPLSRMTLRMVAYDLVCIVDGHTTYSSKAKPTRTYGSKQAAQAAGEEWLADTRSTTARRATGGEVDGGYPPPAYFVLSLYNEHIVHPSK